MHGAGFILDSINRMKSNRSLAQRDRGAFDINDKNKSFPTVHIPAKFRESNPQYLIQLRKEIHREKVKNRKILLIRLSISILVFIGFLYLAFAFRF